MTLDRKSVFLTLALALISGAPPANAAGFAIASARGYVPPVPSYDPRIEKIHVGVMTLSGSSNFSVPSDSDYQITQFIHHDGDPMTISNSAMNYSGYQETNLIIGISVDPNSGGSQPKSFRITSDTNGSVVAQYTCSTYYYCSTGFSSDAVGVTAWGIPSGKYTLTVTYWDGSWGRHSMVLNGIASYANGRFGAVQMTGPGGGLQF